MITTPDHCPLCRRRVAERICRFYNTDMQSILTKSRKQTLVSIRMAIIYVSTEYFAPTTLQNNAVLIYRDHSTIVWLKKRLDNKYDYVAQKVKSEMTALFNFNKPSSWK